MIKRIASRIATGGTDIAADPSEQEGSFGVPIGQMISALSTYLGSKYAIDVAYRSFSDRIRGPWRDSLIEHWAEHAEEEREAAYDLAMKIMGLGSDPLISVVQLPVTSGDISAFFKTLENMEMNAIKTGREIIKMSGDNTAMKVMVENIVMVDTQHLDDLRRMKVEI